MLTIRTEIVNQSTGLKKVFATRTEGEYIRTFSVKAPMKTQEQRNLVYDNIWNQYLKEKNAVPDIVVTEGKANLEFRETL